MTKIWANGLAGTVYSLNYGLHLFGKINIFFTVAANKSGRYYAPHVTIQVPAIF